MRSSQSFAVLFASDRDGGGALYLHRQGATLERLTDPVQVRAWEPAISADGEQILFTGRRDDQSDIALMALGGGEVQ
ncbi:MAG: hypothetical protein M3220_06965 [Chloroflexota bacterium]|nr:hypothetical protein [Chloroflexota bacterium]